MKKNIYGILGLLVLFGALLLYGWIKEAVAQVEVNVNLGPPPITVAAPPAVVMVPNSRVYYVPDPNVDVFNYNGYWWAPRGDQWYRSRAYKGPWGVIDQRYVPASVRQVPRDYRVVYEKEKHIPYGQWKKQWKNQNKNKQKATKNELKQYNKKEQKQHQNKGNSQGPGRGHGSQGKD